MPLSDDDYKQKEAESMIKVGESIFSSSMTGFVASFLGLLLGGGLNSPNYWLFLAPIILLFAFLFWCGNHLRNTGFAKLRLLIKDECSNG